MNEILDPECLVFREQSILTEASDIWLGGKETVMATHMDPKK